MTLRKIKVYNNKDGKQKIPEKNWNDEVEARILQSFRPFLYSLALYGCPKISIVGNKAVTKSILLRLYSGFYLALCLYCIYDSYSEEHHSDMFMGVVLLILYSFRYVSGALFINDEIVRLVKLFAEFDSSIRLNMDCEYRRVLNIKWHTLIVLTIIFLHILETYEKIPYLQNAGQVITAFAVFLGLEIDSWFFALLLEQVAQRVRMLHIGLAQCIKGDVKHTTSKFKVDVNDKIKIHEDAKFMKYNHNNWMTEIAGKKKFARTQAEWLSMTVCKLREIRLGVQLSDDEMRALNCRVSLYNVTELFSITQKIVKILDNHFHFAMLTGLVNIMIDALMSSFTATLNQNNNTSDMEKFSKLNPLLFLMDKFVIVAGVCVAGERVKVHRDRLVSLLARVAVDPDGLHEARSRRARDICRAVACEKLTCSLCGLYEYGAGFIPMLVSLIITWLLLWLQFM